MVVKQEPFTVRHLREFSRRNLLQLAGVSAGVYVAGRIIEGSYSSLLRSIDHPFLTYEVTVTKKPWYEPHEDAVLTPTQSAFNRAVAREEGFIRIGCSFPDSKNPYVRIDINDMNNHVLLRGGTRNEKACVVRNIYHNIFEVHVDDGDYRWKERIKFLDNETIFEEIVNDAKNNPSKWKSSGVKFPSSYSVSLGKVSYYVDELPLLFDGNKEDFEEAWLHRVYYASDAVKLERE